VTPPTSDPYSFALAPDGQSIVFVASGEGAPRLWIRSLAGTDARPVPGTEGARHPFWSADSQSVAFFADGALNR
jgi:Tol biopolymer transport system component